VVRWTAGHVGIAGNELADREAKRAAGGTSSDKKLLPTLLQRKLTANSTALKMNHHKAIKEKWKSNWRKLTHGIKMATIDNTIPSKTLLNTISNSKLTRQASSLLTQLRIGHIPLNGYLFRFKLVDSPRCPACGAAEETTHHFLITCRSYGHERWPIIQKLGRTPTLTDLLADQKHTT
jgi:hypothetical protein